MTNAYHRHVIIDGIVADHTRRKAELSRERLLKLTNQALVEQGLPRITYSCLDADLRIFRREFRAPLKNTELRGGYFYSDPEYRRFESVPSQDLIRSVEFVLGFLNTFAGIGIFREAIATIRQMVIRGRCLQGVEETLGYDDGIEIDFRFSEEGSVALEKLYAAHQARNCVRVALTNGEIFDLSPVSFSFSPLGFTCRGFDALSEKEVDIPCELVAEIRPAYVAYSLGDLVQIPDYRRN